MGMITPSKKSPTVEELLEDVSERLYGRSRIDSINNGVCVSCGESEWTLKFRDEISRREYAISGLCQKCQDKVFGI